MVSDLSDGCDGRRPPLGRTWASSSRSLGLSHPSSHRCTDGGFAPWIWWGKDSGAHRVSKARGAKTGKAWISKKVHTTQAVSVVIGFFWFFFLCSLIGIPFLKSLPQAASAAAAAVVAGGLWQVPEGFRAHRMWKCLDPGKAWFIFEVLVIFWDKSTLQDQGLSIFCLYLRKPCLSQNWSVSSVCVWCLLQFHQGAIVVVIVALAMATTQLQGSSLHDVGWWRAVADIGIVFLWQGWVFL